MSNKLYYLYTQDKQMAGEPEPERAYAMAIDGTKIIADEGTKVWWERFNTRARYVYFKSEETQAKD